MINLKKYKQAIKDCEPILSSVLNVDKLLGVVDRAIVAEAKVKKLEKALGKREGEGAGMKTEEEIKAYILERLADFRLTRKLSDYCLILDEEMSCLNGKRLPGCPLEEKEV